MSKKINEAVMLIKMMQSNAEGISYEDIQQQFNVSLRTAQRMIAECKDTIPTIQESVIEGKNKKWKIPSSAIAPLFSIQSEEMAALNHAIQHFKQYNLHDMASSLILLENKLKSIAKTSRKTKNLMQEAERLLNIEGFSFRARPKFCIEDSLLTKLRNALINKKQIEISYYNKRTHKYNKNTLDPYGILYSELNHYLLARHSDNYYGDEIHHFILSNIESINVLDTAAVIPEEFNLSNYCKDMFGVFKEKPFNVEWLFSKSVAHEVKNYIFHPSQILITNNDGSITVKFKSGGALEMSWHLYMWGDHVKVIEPKNFWDNI